MAISVLAYNTGLKRTLVGPLVMGLCRSLNVLLGMAVRDRISEDFYRQLLKRTLLVIAMILIVQYLIGI